MAATAARAGAQAAQAASEDAEVVRIDALPHEDDAMVAAGLAHARHPDAVACELAVSPRVAPARAADAARHLFMFQHLRRLQLRCVALRGATRESGSARAA